MRLPTWVAEILPFAFGACLVVAALWLVDRGQKRAFAIVNQSLDGLRIAQADSAVQAREGLRVHEEVVRSMSMLKGLHPHHADPKTFTPSTVARKDAEHVEQVVAEEAELQERADRSAFEREKAEWARIEAVEAAAAEQAALAYRNAIDARAKV